MAKNNNQNKANLNHSVGQFQKPRNTEEFSQELDNVNAQHNVSNSTQRNKNQKNK